MAPITPVPMRKLILMVFNLVVSIILTPFVMYNFIETVKNNQLVNVPLIGVNIMVLCFMIVTTSDYVNHNKKTKQYKPSMSISNDGKCQCPGCDGISLPEVSEKIDKS